ncbi:ATP-binding protein [Streptomyces sp. NPDC005408]|uniref:ATP-binding protein n=1 Tax=Streptomyces sp. NPDC005408 TaxID=3155341 RepID=UPI0033A8F895
MSACRYEVKRKSWELPFLAEPEEVAGLRRIMRLHLNHWGLPGAVEAAQLCVSELVANVITHVGAGTPTTLTVSMKGTHLRLEVQDPDSRSLPTLLSAHSEEEAGRGLSLVDSVADRWGVMLTASGKTTWVELATELSAANGHVSDPRVSKAEAVLALYGYSEAAPRQGTSLLSLAAAEEVSVHLIADLLHWLCAHGRDPDEAMDRAQIRFESEAGQLA